MRLSGTTTNARISIDWDRNLAGPNPSITLIPKGPIKLIEEDTPPHAIRPRQQRGVTYARKRKGKQALKYGGRFSAYANHPGTRGKHPWRRGVQKTRSESGAIFDREIQKAIVRAMAA